MIDASAMADPAASHNNPTILVVDDEVLVRAMISDELRHANCTVIEAANADEALAVLRTDLRIDLVFTDMQMPGTLDGAALVHLIRAEFPLVKVVMIAGQLASEATRGLLDGYISKPFVPAQLRACLHELTIASGQWAQR